VKKIFIFAAIAILASGCTSRTEHGECIGAFDEGVPDLQYKLSIKNTVLAVLFSETIFVPVIVVANEARCPVGKKVQK
jgi:hypothetical protein